MKSGLIDIHEHLLYGMDDGPKKRSGMYRMLEQAAGQGVAEIVATPHVTPGVRSFDRAQYQKALQEARDYCLKQGLEITIHEGAEILYTDQACRLLVKGDLPTMAGSDCVLVEFSPDVRYEALCEALSRLLSHGYRPILAHVERYRCLVIWPPRAEKLKKDMEVFFQVNCSTVIEGKGFLVRRFVDRMMRGELIDALASDAHGTSSRPNRLRRAWVIARKKYGAAYARRLVSGEMLKG